MSSKRRAANDIVIRDFCSRRGLSDAALSPGLRAAIVAVGIPFQLYVESLDMTGIAESEDPLDGLLATLILRTYTCANGSLALVAVGQLQEGEIVARTVVESSINGQYILQRDTKSRVLQFCHSYVAKERLQNRRWHKAASIGDRTAGDEHSKRIDEKETALAGYEMFLRHVSPDHSDSDGSKIGWPSIEQLFASLGKGLEYRTVYAALCSQAHHDAEDILNRFFVDSLADNEAMSARMRREKHTFSLYMILLGLRCFVEYVEMLGGRYRLHPVSVESQAAKHALSEEIELMIRCLDDGTFPTRWQAKLIEGV